jgi:hypothetical protein
MRTNRIILFREWAARELNLSILKLSQRLTQVGIGDRS